MLRKKEGRSLFSYPARLWPAMLDSSQGQHFAFIRIGKGKDAFPRHLYTRLAAILLEPKEVLSVAAERLDLYDALPVSGHAGDGEAKILGVDAFD
jgi:hypothetical protein